jgi:hypothetical protein
MANHRLKGISPKHRAMIKRLQPYRAGDEAWRHPLGILVNLSNADKHRLLNPTYSIVKSDAAQVLDDLIGSFQGDGPSPAKSWWMLKQGSRLEHDAAWFRVGFDRAVLTERPAKVEVSGLLRLGVAFGEMGLDADSYRHIGESVWHIIERFMRHFPETKYID